MVVDGPSDGSPPRLILNKDLVHPETDEVAGGFATSYSSRCPGRVKVNEDCAAVIPIGANAGVLAVADGVGGMPAGNQASAEAIRVLYKVIRSRHAAAQGSATPRDLNLRGAILDGFEQANQAVLAMGSGAATTLAVVEIVDNKARPYHAGDTEILHVGQRGKIKHQTVPHSPVGYAVEAGLLNEEEAMVHHERHYISNMVGSASMHVTVGPASRISPRDTLLLASDGLSDNVMPTELISRIRVGKAEDVVTSLKQTAHERMSGASGHSLGKPDDLTMIVFRRR